MTFLLVVHTLLALALVGVILMQKSEGGGLTGGGNAGGLVSARGAANLLTRTTAILAALFILSSLGLAWLAGHTARPGQIDTSLARQTTPVGPLGAPKQNLPGQNLPGQNLPGATPGAPLPLPAGQPAQAPASAPADSVPVQN